MLSILVIDDEKDIRESIKDFFELYDHSVYLAHDGRAGIKMAKELQPDIIICDISMPGIDGFEVKKILESNKKTSTIPFLFLTAKADAANLRRGMSLGADDYIIKPIDPNELLEIINGRLKRIKSLRESLIEKYSTKQTDDKIVLEYDKEIIFLTVNDINVICVAGDYSTVYTLDGKKYTIKRTAKKWLEILPGNDFVPARRNTIININHIIKVEHFFNGILVAKINKFEKSIQFSKRYSALLKNKFKD